MTVKYLQDAFPKMSALSTPKQDCQSNITYISDNLKFFIENSKLWQRKSGQSNRRHPVLLRSKFSKTATPKLTEEWKPVPSGTFLTWKSPFKNYFPGAKFAHESGTLSKPEVKRLMALLKINISCKVHSLVLNSIASWVAKN